MRSLARNTVLLSALALTALFLFLLRIFDRGNLIILLNGLFVGSIVSVVIAYKELIWQAVVGVGIYDRIRQMTLSFFLQWCVIIIGALTSIYIRALDLPSPVFTSVALMRYLSVIAALLQVTAPDFGLGLFHGRDRKVLSVSLSVGFIVAIIFVLIQAPAIV